MNTIINGRKYDTSTAELISEWDNGFSAGDFKHSREVLYRKRTGEFFLYGVGGPMSEYAEACSEGWCGGEKISPYTEAEARAWCEKHLGVDEYESIFGVVEEKNSTTDSQDLEEVLQKIKELEEELAELRRLL